MFTLKFLKNDPFVPVKNQFRSADFAEEVRKICKHNKQKLPKKSEKCTNKSVKF